MTGKKIEIHDLDLRERDLLERVSALEARMPHMATKAWVLVGLGGCMAFAVTQTYALIELLLN